jgi:hypothetical protein
MYWCGVVIADTSMFDSPPVAFVSGQIGQSLPHVRLQIVALRKERQLIQFQSSTSTLQRLVEQGVALKKTQTNKQNPCTRKKSQ